ncbi:MAG: type II toxin-antitoxin system RelE/ParE family toxin [Candidatus Sulfotelmatobacter sp.]
MTRHTKNVYTSNKKSDDFSGPSEHRPLVSLVFHGDSRRVLRAFPESVQGDLGYALYRLQLGQIPPDRKVVREVGAGVYELRDEDEKTWYRVLYVRRTNEIQVLHCFEKRSNSIEQKDIDTAKARLKRVLEAEREEKKNAKQALHRR